MKMFRNVEERVRNTEWFSRVQDTKVWTIIFTVLYTIGFALRLPGSMVLILNDNSEIGVHM